MGNRVSDKKVSIIMRLVFFNISGPPIFVYVLNFKFKEKREIVLVFLW